ncbi:MAG: S1C family serine protease [Leucobacter sp.]
MTTSHDPEQPALPAEPVQPATTPAAVPTGSPQPAPELQQPTTPAPEPAPVVHQPAAPAPAPTATDHQPTVPLPGSPVPPPPPVPPSGAAFGAAPNGAVPGTAPTVTADGAHPKSRSGALVAGIAIGALLGGLVGGGTAAVVGANLPQQSQTAAANPAGTITLNNTEEVGMIAAVASVATPSVVTLEVAGSQAAGSGSGVIYTEDGYIITNSHVATLDGAVGAEASIRVRLSDGRVFDGALVGTDPFSDIAVVKIEADDLTPIAIGDSNRLNVGDVTVAIGAPLNLANTVTSGVVSALYRGIAVGTANLPDDSDPSDEDGNGGSPWDFRFGNPGEGGQRQQSNTVSAVVTLPVIQTDASINPGNSGGALVNANAELIGVNVAIASNSGDSSTAGSDGLGFAIPSDLAVRVADAIIAGEQPSHGLLGASVDDSRNDTDEDANRTGGLLVALTPGGAAESAGLKVGDVITSVNGIPVDSGTTLSAVIRMQEGGSEVVIGYTRGGEPGEVTATLGTLEW